MATVSRSRLLYVAAALVLLLEGGTHDADAFVLPSGLATQRPLLLPDEEQNAHKPVWTPLHSFKFIKGETSYGDISEGSSGIGRMGQVGFGGSVGGGNSLNRRRRREPMWWSQFSRNTPTTLLAAGFTESWPVMEADDIQVLVKKGDDIEEDRKAQMGYGSSNNKHVKATLERWESDIALEVVGRDGYPMRGNQMQPNGYNSNNQDGRCTQSIKFDVSNGDLYPFSGTISVPPPLTVEDSYGNEKTVMMVLNNPDDENDQNGFMQQQQYDDYGNEIPKSKPSPVEAKLEPLYKSPDEKYAEAQQQQQQQMQYDEWGNEVYNPQQQQQGEQKATIPSNGYQSFELDATDPSSGKIKISLEREEGGGGFGFGGGGNSASEARVEIYHGFKDQYGNPYNNNFGDEEEDKRMSLEVSTMHPTFSTVLDTMPANLLAKHSLPNANDVNFVRPYLEVRVVNTGGASLKAGVQNFLPQYKPKSQQQRSKQQYQKQRYEQMNALNGASSLRADNPFLLTDSTQSSTSSRRMKDTNTMFGQEKTYVRAASSSNSQYSGRNSNTRISEMWGPGSSGNTNSNYNYYQDQGMARPSWDGYSNSFDSFGVKANNPEDLLKGSTYFGETDNNMRYRNNRVLASARNRPYDSYGNNNNDYYGYGNEGVIDTIATSRTGSSGLVANNDFTKANVGSKTSAIVPGSGVRLQSFGGNSGGASGMQQPYQGRAQYYNGNNNRGMFQASQSYNGYNGYVDPSYSNGGNFQSRPQSESFNGMKKDQSFNNNNDRSSGMFQGRSQSPSYNGMQQEQSFGNNNNGGSSMFSGRSQSQSQSFGNNGMQSQSFGNNNGRSSMSQGRSQSQSFGNSNGRSSMSQGRSQSFGNNNGGNSAFQGRSNNGMQGETFGIDNLRDNAQKKNVLNGSMQRSGGGFQESFSDLTSPRKTRSVPGQRSNGNQQRYNSAFSGNGNVIGNGVVAGRPASDSTTVGSNNRMMRTNQNDGYSGNNNGFQQPRLGPGNNNSNNNNRFGNAQSSSFQSSFTPEASNNFGGDPMGGSFGNSNRMGSNMKQQVQGSDSFSRGNNNNRNQGGLKNMFGGNNNNNNQQRNGGRMNNNNNNNRFGGNNNDINNNSFGGNSNNNRFGGNSNNSNKNSFGSSSSNNNRFGGNSNNNSFGGSSSSNNNFGGNNNSFGRSSNNNNSFGRNNNNSFGGNNNNSFGGSSSSTNSGSPFGNLGKAPQTRGNSQNPFAKLNGEATPQQNNGYSNNNGFSTTNNNNNSFGGGGAPQRPLSPTPGAKKNPFGAINGNNGRSSTVMMGSRSNINKTDNDNPVVSAVKNLFSGNR